MKPAVAFTCNAVVANGSACLRRSSLLKPVQGTWYVSRFVKGGRWDCCSCCKPARLCGRVENATVSAEGMKSVGNFTGMLEDMVTLLPLGCSGWWVAVESE